MVFGHRQRNKKLIKPTDSANVDPKSGRLRNLYKSFLKINIMPSEVDKQELDTLYWIILSQNEEETKQNTDTPIMGLL